MEEVLENLLDEFRQNPIDKLRDYGYDNFSDFINFEALKDDLRDEYDASELNYHSSDYEEITINDTVYTVFEID